MYIPEHFRVDDLAELHEVMRQNSFTTVVTQHDGQPYASHLPLLLESRGEFGVLAGHMARANPQWQDFAAGAEILVIFHGPHAYVSPGWYENPQSVPTWNYVAVHAYGTARMMDEMELEGLLPRMVDSYQGADESWRYDLPQEMRARMLQAIVGFEITLTRVEGKFKLSQNRPVADQRRVIEKLSQGTEINNSQGVASEMGRRLKEE
jgi:transcriptional regulator